MSPFIPGVPAAGHIASNGSWHPGHEDDCPKCEPPSGDIIESLFPDGRPAWSAGCYAARRLDGDEWLTVIPLTFNRARLCVATAENASVEHWCMDNQWEALTAWALFPPPPTRWNRHQRRDRTLEWPDGRTEP